MLIKLELLKNLKFLCHTRSFTKAKRRGDLKIKRAEIATAPSELCNDNKKDFFSDLKFNISGAK